MGGGLRVNGCEQRQWKGRWRSTLIVWISRGINSHRWQPGSYSLTWEGSEEAIKTTPGTDSQHIKRERDLHARGSPSGRRKLCEVGVLQNASESTHLIEGNTFKCQRKHKLLYLNGFFLWGQKKTCLWLIFQTVKLKCHPKALWRRSGLYMSCDAGSMLHNHCIPASVCLGGQQRGHFSTSCFKGKQQEQTERWWRHGFHLKIGITRHNNEAVSPLHQIASSIGGELPWQHIGWSHCGSED